jgi:hypothetical protein
MPLCLPQVMALKTLYKISLLIAGASDFFKRGIRKKTLAKIYSTFTPKLRNDKDLARLYKFLGNCESFKL